MPPRTIIVGAGPAGIRAAEALVAEGIRPLVIDEGQLPGGQIYRQSPVSRLRSARDVYGVEAPRASSVHHAFELVNDRIDYRPGTIAYDAKAGEIAVVSSESNETLAWDALILATGATDRIIPFQNWTAPGVFTLGGAQTALKAQACTIGNRPIFIGTGPLLYLVAYQYLKAGIRPLAVLDTSPLRYKLRSLARLVYGGKQLLHGLRYIATLALSDVTLASGVSGVAAETDSDGHVAGVSWRDAGGRHRRVSCDSVATGFGLRSETQLAELCGATFSFDDEQRQWLPATDRYGRTDVAGLYVAGDGSKIQGARAAEVAGMRAAHAALIDLGLSVDRNRLNILAREYARYQRFSRALSVHAFPFPGEIAASSEDDQIVCRCEGATAGDLRRAVREKGASEINRVKAFTRIGMGRCQGRVCAAAAAEIVADALGSCVSEGGYLRTQAPIKPVSLAMLAKGATT